MTSLKEWSQKTMQIFNLLISSVREINENVGSLSEGETVIRQKQALERAQGKGGRFLSAVLSVKRSLNW